MSTVGDEKVFAIEWKFHSANGRWIFAHLQYWGNCIPIGDWEDTVVFPSVVIDLQRYACREQFDFPVDCSSFSKEYLFSAIYESFLDQKCDKKYFEFYRLAREAMEIYVATHEYFSYYNYLELLRDNNGIAFSDNDYDDEKELAHWISMNFDIAGMGSCAIEDHAKLYFVQDVSKNQERLIWKNKYRHPDDVYCRYIPSELSEQTYETVMPAGYFKETIREFVRVASNEIAEMKNEAKDFNYSDFIDKIAPPATVLP